MASRIVFQIFGGFTVFFAAGLVFMSAVVPRARALFATTGDYVRVGLTVALLTIVGVGLLRARKWAAVMLSLGLVYPAYSFLWAAIHPVQATGYESYWPGYILAALLLIPACMTVFCWRSAIWQKG